jgi:hypothetical protein
MLARPIWTQAEQRRFLEKMAASYESIVIEIDQLVQRAAALARSFDPLELLQRAWWERAAAHCELESESQAGADQALASRMIDYVQCLIVSSSGTAGLSLPPASVEGESWVELKDIVSKIFNKISVDYFIASKAQRDLSGAPLSAELEELQFEAQIYWMNVTGDQYQNHQVVAMREMLAPQSEVIHELWGLSADELCDELEKIWDAQIFGFGRALQVLQDAAEATGSHGAFPPDQKALALVLSASEIESVRGVLSGYDLFDLRKVTDLPDSFLSLFSWKPGEDSQFFAPGELAGWPLREWPIDKRPFICVGSSFYCFDHSALFDGFFRQLEKKVFSAGESFKQRWIAARKEVSELVPLKYLQKILPGATLIREAYYPIPGVKRGRAEVDGLVLFEDHLFVVEVKSGSFTYTSPATDFPAFINSLQDLVASPSVQGERFMTYLRGSSEAPIFDSSNREIARIRLSDFRHVSVMAITLDPFTEIAAQIHTAKAAGVHLAADSVWSLSIDDLRVYAEIFDGPVEFLHYVEQRLTGQRNGALHLNDELDHLGLYIHHNNYSDLARDALKEGADRIQFLGYRHDIDVFFSRKLGGELGLSPLRQKMPVRMIELVDFLNASTCDGRARIGAALLNLSGDARREIFDGVELQLREWNRVRPIFMSIDEGMLAVCVWLRSPSEQERQQLIDQLVASSFLANKDASFLLHLIYDSKLVLTDVLWEWRHLGCLSQSEIKSVENNAEDLRARRLAAARMKGPIRRNDLCPCYSGKKYKNCCVNR